MSLDVSQHQRPPCFLEDDDGPSTTPFRLDDLDEPDNVHRHEMLWGPEEEQLLTSWVGTLQQRAQKHARAYRLVKTLYSVLMLPSVILPVVATGVNTVYWNQIRPVESALLILVIGVLNGICAFFELGQLYQQHDDFEQRYDNLAVEMQMELRKPRAFRIPCDVALERYFQKMRGLNDAAPFVSTGSGTKATTLQTQRLCLYSILYHVTLADTERYRSFRHCLQVIHLLTQFCHDQHLRQKLWLSRTHAHVFLFCTGTRASLDAYGLYVQRVPGAASCVELHVMSHSLSYYTKSRTDWEYIHFT